MGLVMPQCACANKACSSLWCVFVIGISAPWVKFQLLVYASMYIVTYYLGFKYAMLLK